jgi:hypothetical protein
VKLTAAAISIQLCDREPGGAAGVPFKCHLSVYNSTASIGPENFFHHGTEISKHSVKALGRLQCHSAWFRIQDMSTGSES